ncbi:hypothetical protein JTB14_030771 [Gonioctena quinquepunctata]|nr:hypothetical protein JTB14_030771 [Gonioctena quinquepunctata]
MDCLFQILKIGITSSGYQQTPVQIEMDIIDQVNEAHHIGICKNSIRIRRFATLPPLPRSTCSHYPQDANSEHKRSKRNNEQLLLLPDLLLSKNHQNQSNDTHKIPRHSS